MIKKFFGISDEKNTVRAHVRGRRALCAVLAAVMAMSMALTGCGGKNNTESTAPSADATTTAAAGESGESGADASESESVNIMDGTTAESGEAVAETFSAPSYEAGTNNSRAAMTVNGRDISFASAAFFGMSARDYYKSYYASYGMELDSSFWGAMADEAANLTYADACMEEVEMSLLQTALLDEHIGEYGPDGLDESVLTEAENGVNNMFSQFTDEELAKVGVTSEGLQPLRDMYKNAYIVRQRLIRDFQYDATDDEARTLTVRVFALSTDTEEGDTDGPKVPTVEEAAKLAQSAIDRIKAGEDADTVMADIGTTISSDSLSVGQYASNPFVDAVLALNEGESTVYRDDDGGAVYGVICDKVNEPEALAARKAEIRDEKASDNFQQVYTDWLNASSHSVNEDVWSEIKNAVFAD